MGYALYETPLGDAGYSVTDTCHQGGCGQKIDRGLDYLCGNQPGDLYGEYGCGRWFCGRHLRYADADVPGVSQCGGCYGRGWRDEDEAAEVSA